MTAPELLPCPFCGKVAHLRDDVCHSTAFFVGCETLGCFGNALWDETKEEAVSNWNTRADIAADPAPVSGATVQEAAKVLLDNCPNPIFDSLKPKLIGEFSQSLPVFDADGNETTRAVNISWVNIKLILASALRAIAGENGNENG